MSRRCWTSARGDVEVEVELARGADPVRLEDEIGDAAPSASTSRVTPGDPGAALRQANAKFDGASRDGVACRIARAGFDALGLEAQEALWREVSAAGGWRTRGLLALPARLRAGGCGRSARRSAKAATIIARSRPVVPLIGSPMTQTEKPMKTVGMTRSSELGQGVDRVAHAVGRHRRGIGQGDQPADQDDQQDRRALNLRSHREGHEQIEQARSRTVSDRSRASVRRHGAMRSVRVCGICERFGPEPGRIAQGCFGASAVRN